MGKCVVVCPCVRVEVVHRPSGLRLCVTVDTRTGSVDGEVRSQHGGDFVCTIIDPTHGGSQLSSVVTLVRTHPQTLDLPRLVSTVVILVDELGIREFGLSV